MHLVTLSIAVLVAAGAAYATIPSGNVITGCDTRSGGTLRVIDPAVMWTPPFLPPA